MNAIIADDILLKIYKTEILYLTPLFLIFQFLYSIFLELLGKLQLQGGFNETKDKGFSGAVNILESLF